MVIQVYMKIVYRVCSSSLGLEFYHHLRLSRANDHYEIIHLFLFFSNDIRRGLTSNSHRMVHDMTVV